MRAGVANVYLLCALPLSLTEMFSVICGVIIELLLREEEERVCTKVTSRNFIPPRIYVT